MRTQILLAYDGAPPLTAAADLSAASASVPQAIGKPCPAWVFANDQDYAYGRFLLDERSLQYVTTHIDTVTDTFRRALLWGALWDSVRELQLAPAAYIRLAVRALPAENDEALTQSVLAHIGTAFERYISDAQRIALAPDLEAMLERRMQDAPNLGLRILYYRGFRSIATTPAALVHLKSILAGQSGVPGLEIKPLDRWTMLTTLLAHADPDAPALLHAEQQRDSTGDGRKYAYVAAAARPDDAAKRQYFKDYMENRALQEDWIEQSLAAFNYWNQSALTLPYLEPALAALPQIKRERKIFFVLAWLNAFVGGQDSAAAASEVRQWLKAHPPDPDLERKVLEVLDEPDRTVRIRARFSP
jgi:aminopeptidase N